jgi:hypothetical protein
MALFFCALLPKGALADRRYNVQKSNMWIEYKLRST